MVGKSPLQTIGDLFCSSLSLIVSLNHFIVLASKNIEWNEIDKKLSSCFSQHGRKSMSTSFIGSFWLGFEKIIGNSGKRDAFSLESLFSV